MSDLTGVLIIGSKGAVATTLIAAGLMSQRGGQHFDLPSEAEPMFAHLNLTPLSQLRFGGWDICDQSYHEALHHHGVIPPSVISECAELIQETISYPGVQLEQPPIHDQLSQDNRVIIDPQSSLRVLTNILESDIQDFKHKTGVSHVVLLDLSSTAKAPLKSEKHDSLERFEEALDAPVQESLGELSEGMLYTYAALKQCCSCVNFTPSLTFDIPALIELSHLKRVPMCGKDGKTGQTLYKTTIAPMLRQRALRVKGWYSTNILGNRDGEVLDHPEHCQTKIESKQAVLSDILGYDDFDHQVHIHYYKPRGDAKEAWDNIDLEGWFGVQMQMKINWLGWDSILAAPLAADLVRWMRYYYERGEVGLLPQLSSYFKSPLGTTKHHLFEQVHTLKEDILSHSLSLKERDD